MDLYEELKKFGLNSYQTKAIVFLLENPDSTAEEVSQGFGIPIAKVYQVLDSPAKMGWCLILWAGRKESL